MLSDKTGMNKFITTETLLLKCEITEQELRMWQVLELFPQPAYTTLEEVMTAGSVSLQWYPGHLAAWALLLKQHAGSEFVAKFIFFEQLRRQFKNHNGQGVFDGVMRDEELFQLIQEEAWSLFLSGVIGSGLFPDYMALRYSAIKLGFL